MNARNDISERRISERRDTSETAQLRIPGMSVIECVIRDLSPEGAGLIPLSGDLSLLPEKVLLFIPGIGEVWAAAVRWGRDGAFGVKFLVDETEKPGSQAAHPDLFTK